MSSDKGPEDTPPAIPPTPSSKAEDPNDVPVKADPVMERFLKSKEFNILMVILTIYALFGDDLRLAYYDLEEDQIFYNLSIFAMVMFLVEMGLQYYYRVDYRWGFYFFLDIVSTASMIPDTNLINFEGESAASSMKAGKTSRAGAKAGRVVKIVRLIRFVRIFKILKMRKQVSSNRDNKITITVSRTTTYEPESLIVLSFAYRSTRTTMRRATRVSHWRTSCRTSLRR